MLFRSGEDLCLGYSKLGYDSRSIMSARGELTQATEQATGKRSGAGSRVHSPDRWIAARVQRMIEPAGVRLELWDGSSSYAGSREPIGDLLVGDRRTLLGLAVNPDLWFGESYMTGRLEVRGPLEPVIEALTANTPSTPSWRQRLEVAFAHGDRKSTRLNSSH